MSLLTEMNYNDSRFSELGKNRNMDIHLLNQIRGAVWKFIFRPFYGKDTKNVYFFIILYEKYYDSHN